MAGPSNLPPDVIALLMKEVAELKAFVEKLRSRRKPAPPAKDGEEAAQPLPELPETHEPHDP